MEKDLILEMKSISKSFGGVEVLHNVDFSLKPGEVHVLIGENGAGKSTLMKILSGVEQKDSGSISLLNDSGILDEISYNNPLTAKKSGIHMVYQESNLLDNLTIAENLYLGNEPLKNGKIDWTYMFTSSKDILKTVKCDLNPKILVENLSVAEKQSVEIAKALSTNAKILIFDEPTSSLSDREVEILFDRIAEAKKKGIGIIYISHRMDEIFEIGDRITVFRDGFLIDTVNVSDTTPSDLVKMMIGRKLESSNEEVHSLPDDTPIKLSIRNVKINDNDEPINLDVLEGEILGIFGLVGAGRTELARIVFGIDPINNGELFVDGKKVYNNSPSDAINNGFALLPEDRKRIGLISCLSIKQNMVLVKLRELKRVLFREKIEKNLADEYINRLSLACRNQDQLVSNLSGGNQQKVVYAKWLMTNPQIMILDEPTRGIDVGVKAEIYSLMREMAKKKITIIMISSDLPEILRVSNRIAVMHDHHITLVDKSEFLNQQKIMEAAIK